MLGLLTIVSLLTLYSALHQGGEMKRIELFWRQIVWWLFSWGLFAFFAFGFNQRNFYDAAWVLYGITVVLLAIILVIGESRMGAQRWLTIFGLNFQPSELAKFSVIILLSRFLSRLKYLPRYDGLRNFIQQLVIPFIPVAVLFGLIFIQPDLGTALLLILLFLLMAAIGGVKRNYIAIVCAIGSALLPLGWFMLKDYQKARLTVFLNPDADPLGAGYTIIQSKIAIGSGQFWGKGFLAGTQNQLNFLPERHTDFIFTIIAEERGFLGVIVLVGLYYILIRTIYSISIKVVDDFSKCMGVGIACLFTMQLFINLSMTMGLLPVVGIPLLFMSYGGTHLMVECMLVGIVFNIARQNRI